jgi:sugar lactone lactonase YvrE
MSVPVRPHALLVLAALCLAGCGGTSARPDLVWGKKGVRDGDLARPRAAVIDREDRLYIVDFTARIQAFDLDGHHLGVTWSTPDYRKGRPSGLALDREGNLIVCDSHYHCLRFYTPEGKQFRLIDPGAGSAPGKLGYVSDVVQDDDGFFYIAEFGEVQRISKFDTDGKFVTCWGSEGMEPGQFGRARALALGPDGLLYVADSCNHRIQVFSRDGRLVRTFGSSGSEPGELSYPYDLAFGPKGDLYVVELGNHRVQKFTATGESLGTWGGPGRAPGPGFYKPWALAVDRKGRVHVLDTENHRVQRFSF